MEGKLCGQRVGEAVAASLGDALLECEPFAGRVGLHRIVVADECAEIDEMRLGNRPFGERDRLAFFDELLGRHWSQ